MGDVYKDIDFERMLSDLGAALERNKQPPGSLPAEQPTVYPQTLQQPRPDGIPTARFPDVPAGGPPPQGDWRSRQLDDFGPAPGPMSPQDAQTLAELNQLSGDVPNPNFQAAAQGANMNGYDGVRPVPGGYAYAKDVPWGGDAETRAAEGLYPTLRPPAPQGSPMAQQLQQAAAQPTAMSAPPPQYPNIDPQADGGLAGYAALRR